jgi:hypothetical protein
MHNHEDKKLGCYKITFIMILFVDIIMILVDLTLLAWSIAQLIDQWRKFNGEAWSSICNVVASTLAVICVTFPRVLAMVFFIIKGFPHGSAVCQAAFRFCTLCIYMFFGIAMLCIYIAMIAKDDFRSKVYDWEGPHYTKGYNITVMSVIAFIILTAIFLYNTCVCAILFMYSKSMNLFQGVPGVGEEGHDQFKGLKETKI